MFPVNISFTRSKRTEASNRRLFNKKKKSPTTVYDNHCMCDQKQLFYLFNFQKLCFKCLIFMRKSHFIFLITPTGTFLSPFMHYFHQQLN